MGAWGLGISLRDPTRPQPHRRVENAQCRKPNDENRIGRFARQTDRSERHFVGWPSPFDLSHAWIYVPGGSVSRCATPHHSSHTGAACMRNAESQTTKIG